MPGIHHVSIGVNDVARAKVFYDPLMRIVDKRRATPGNGVRLRRAWMATRSRRSSTLGDVFLLQGPNL
jgi:catechol 2,3-dioxygenase-like lactoylglutathione lyase family enzyme